MIIPEMTTEYKNFIGIYKNVYPADYCDHLISEFERLVNSGAGSNRQKSENELKHRKNDMQLGLNFGVHAAAAFCDQSSEEIFFKGLQRCFEHYSEQYSVLQQETINATAMKMQRTDSGGGYHIWHSEHGGGKFAERVLVYSLYLNDISETDGGETEFLYQRLRIRPEKNMMVLWPAAFTHTHRGNTVLGDESKYIVTGWFYYD
jgi:hypothetical protein